MKAFRFMPLLPWEIRVNLPKAEPVLVPVALSRPVEVRRYLRSLRENRKDFLY